MSTEFIKTLKLRVKDKHNSFLSQQAREVNFVWNYINELSYKHLQRTGKFFSAYDMDKYTRGSTKEGLSIFAQSIQAIQEEYVTRKRKYRKAKLRWRSNKKSLGWVPFKKSAIKYRNGQVWYCGKPISLWDSYDLSKYELGTGSFNQDSRGRWYFNTTVKVKQVKTTATSSVGIDLGLKEAAVTSQNQRLEGHWYRDMEEALKTAQRANKTQRVRAVHTKIKNRRKDDMHKWSSAVVKNNAAVFVGNVSSSKLVKTRMAKSTYDASWYMLKVMLEYKCKHAGVIYEEVNEAYTTQTCSECGSISDSSPKGIAGLGIREWTCSECGTTHDRDVNAAKNILAAGHCRLAVGTITP